MKGDYSLLRHAKHPYLAFLVLAVGGGLGLGATYLTSILRNDPTMVIKNKKANPYPWVHVDQSKNLKMYAVNNKFDKGSGVKKSYVLD